MTFRRPYEFINPKELVSLLRTRDKDIAIVDVRDADYEGGHITGAIHSPSATFLNGGVDSLRDQVKDKKTVIFHCMLSQVRGPKAARIYAETVDEIRRRGGDTPREDQEVLVLRGGFEDFQALTKGDKDLIEDYDPDFWEQTDG